MSNVERGKPNFKPRTSNLEPRTSNLKPQMSNVERRTRNANVKPQTVCDQLQSQTFSKKYLHSPNLALYLHPHSRGSSSVGRAPAFQAGCREFEPRLPLQESLIERLGFFYFWALRKRRAFRGARHLAAIPNADRHSATHGILNFNDKNPTNCTNLLDKNSCNPCFL